MTTVSVWWLRRDLRLHDNAAFYHALQSPYPTLPVFIFDTDILDKLENRADARVQFIHDTLTELQNALAVHGSSLKVYYGNTLNIWKKILTEYDVKAVFTNRDYEAYAITRDAKIAELLAAQNASFNTYKDHVIFEQNEVTKDDGKPYTVFTPYSRKWRARLTEADLASYENEKYFGNLLQISPLPIISLAEMGFERGEITIPSTEVAQSVIKNYEENRNFPALPNSTSRLGVHFRFGTISVREKARKAMLLSDTYVNELIWRDFYSQILWHFPHVIGAPFSPKYAHIAWRDAPADFERWCVGKTGYPLVDAGMRELNATGYMHNRVRMVVASFLTKHLLIDWQLGEAYFAAKLLDFDLASNNGGWQWAAGCGTDAAPYFRVFNPTAQQEKFDKSCQYIRKWIPEFGTPMYVNPMVEHKFARERCLETYKKGLERAAD